MLTCRICGYQNKDLKNHLSRVHSMGVRTYIDRYGEHPRPQEILEARAARKASKRLKCNLCSYMTLSARELDDHFKTSDDPAHSHQAYTGAEGADFIECQICHLRRRKLDAHIRSAHGLSIEEYKSQYSLAYVVCDEWLEDNRDLNGMKSEEKRESRRGENNPFFGETHPPERLAHMAESYKRTIAEKYPDGHFNKGIIRTDEFKKNCSIRASKHTYGRGGFRDDLDHYCRSRLEANYARILRYQGISYSWEPTTFMVTRPDGVTSAYTPDFYLPEEDIYVETKPYLMLDSSYKNSEKIELFKLQYPHINLKIIFQQSEEWRNLRQQYQPLIQDWEP